MTTAGMRDLQAELDSPKYAHVERERRWLADPERRPRLDGLSHVSIEDRYIRGTRLRLRSMTCSQTGARTWKLTKKYDALDPAARPIVTAYLSDAEHEVFAALDADLLTKRRFTIRHAGLNWSLDCFDGPLAPLECLEVEAESPELLTRLDPPHWALVEITADARFEGAALARNGIPGGS